MRTREEVRGVIWFMRVSNTRAMHISRHWPCVVQMWYLSNKCWIGIVALQMVKCHGWGQKWLSIYIKHAYQWSMTKWCRQTDVYHWSSWELALILSQASVWDVVHECYHRACSRWVSQQLSDQQKLNRMATSLTNLQCYKAECTDFLSCIIICGCTILKHRWRRNSWCWKIPLASTVVVHENCEHGADTMFWDSHRLILVNCMLHGITVTAVGLQLVLQCLTEAFHHQRPGLLTWYCCCITPPTPCWTCVPHPQQSPDCSSLGCSRFWKTGEKKLCRLVISICQHCQSVTSVVCYVSLSNWK